MSAVHNGSNGNGRHVEPAAHTTSRNASKRVGEPRRVLITGGAGFIGSNLADRLLREGHTVQVFDNLSRSGAERNLRRLQEIHGDDRLTITIDDTRDRAAVRRAVWQAEQVFHFAAQVAVTTSLTDPMEDFEVNARGTMNLLDALRRLDNPPSVVFTSTNKVYGALEDVKLREDRTRYEPIDKHLRTHGLSEARPVEFHSPYGCSKGAADQYVLDFARRCCVPGVVFRMSCIYGPGQFGTEDQGWVAHFMIQAMKGRPIRIYGDGKQVRDILFIEDLLDAFVLAQNHIETLSGRAFNIGGGPERTISLIELLDHIEAATGERPATDHDSWRTADQQWYVSDTTAFHEATGWCPRVDVGDGLDRLHQWIDSGRGVRSMRGRVAVARTGGQR